VWGGGGNPQKRVLFLGIGRTMDFSKHWMLYVLPHTISRFNASIIDY
jgi:hypothetical protein